MTSHPDSDPAEFQSRPILDAQDRVIREPRVEQTEWTDPDDDQALQRGEDGKRRAKKVRGYRTVDPIEHLHRRNAEEVTLRHVRAARRLRDIYEAAHGAHGGRDPRRTASTPTQLPVEIQMAAIAQLRSAFQAVGPSLWGALMPVVIHGWTVGKLAEARAVSAHRVAGYLVAALDRLADHFWPEREVATIAPHRQPPDSIDVPDLPPERIGRWRTSASNAKDSCAP